MTIIADAMGRDVIASIADYIEERGHFQGRGDTPDHSDPKQPVCIVLNPAFAEHGHLAVNILIRELRAPHLAAYNDKTPTDILLADLRRIAATR